MILFAGILSRGGSAALRMWQYFQMGAQSTRYYFYVPLVLILFLAMIVFIVVMTSAEQTDSGAVRQTGCWPEDVWRTVHFHADQS